MLEKNLKTEKRKKVFIVAELANIHEGSVGLAKKMIEAAKDCGVDGVKFQTHIFEAESLKDAPCPHHFKEESRESYFKRTSFTFEQYQELKRYTENLGIEFLSSPFSIEAIEFLEKLGIKILKVPSGEVNNLPYLERLAKTRKKIFLSSGMSSWEELDLAVKTLKENGCQDLTILQCTSKYPCPPEEAGLNLMLEIKRRYNLPVGFSDHTQGIGIAVAAVALGAEVIEKHFTLSKLMYGPDPMYSMEPEEFKLLIKSIREVEKSLNSIIDKDKIAQDLKEVKIIFEKSIVSAKPLKAGTIIKKKDLAFKKPGDGILARDYQKILNKVLKRDVEKDHKFKWEDFK